MDILALYVSLCNLVAVEDLHEIAPRVQTLALDLRDAIASATVDSDELADAMRAHIPQLCAADVARTR